MKGLDRGSLIGCDALVASLRSYFFPLGPSSVVGVVSLADIPLPGPPINIDALIMLFGIALHLARGGQCWSISR